MGLDTVELLMSIEEEFGINIPDEEVTCIYTMGQMRDYLGKHLREREKVHCLSQRGFYILRRALTTTGGFKRNEIQLDMKTGDCLPESDKREFWHRLSDHTKCRLPELVLDRRIKNAGFCLLAVAVVSAYSLLSRLDADLAILGTLVILMPVGALLMLSLNVLQRYPKFVTVPPNLATVRKLSDYIGHHLYDCRENSPQGDIWSRLCKLTADQAGIDSDNLEPETHFIELFPAG